MMRWRSVLISAVTLMPGENGVSSKPARNTSYSGATRSTKRCPCPS